MTEHPLLQPVAVLLGWSLVMMAWMYATRIPAMRRAKIEIANRVGGTGHDLDAILPADVQWKAQNYNHLMEQPTLFYAACLALSVVGVEGAFTVGNAWAYVVLRIVHSLFQSLSNRVAIRFVLFILASGPLALLVGQLLLVAFA